jgi:hypothetical protein
VEKTKPSRSEVQQKPSRREKRILFETRYKKDLTEFDV